MKHPKFNWKTYPADYSELSSGAKMNVSELKGIRAPNDNELTRMLCFNSGIRQTKDLQNWNAWNGCVYIDVDYKNYLSANEKATDPVKVFADVWTYLSDNYSDHFYYGEYSRSLKGFHFIFYTETDYPTEERRDSLLLKANAAVIKAFTDCGYKDAIEYKEIVNGVEAHKVLDTCTNSPYQICYLTMCGKINKKCIGDWRISTHGLEKIIQHIKGKHNSKREQKISNCTYKSKLLKINEVQSVPYIEHLVRRNLFKSLDDIIVLAISFNSSEGSVAVKDNNSVLSISNEIVTECIYNLVASLFKIKLDELRRIIDILKTILMSRLSEMKMSSGITQQIEDAQNI